MTGNSILSSTERLFPSRVFMTEIKYKGLDFEALEHHNKSHGRKKPAAERASVRTLRDLRFVAALNWGECAL